MGNRRYSGNGSKTMSNGEGIKMLAELCRRRWKTKTLGIYANRDKRGKPGNLSVHALWRACDIAFPSVKARNEAAEWLVKNNSALKVDCIIDYGYAKRDMLGRKAFGRAWMCDRQKWKNLKKGEVAGGGEPWADWLHIELGYRYATTENGTLFQKIWERLPK